MLTSLANRIYQRSPNGTKLLWRTMKVRRHYPMHGLLWHWLSLLPAATLAAARARRRIFFAPEMPREATAIWKILKLQGYTLTAEPDGDPILAVKWHDSTTSPPSPALDAMRDRIPVINGQCNDISKHHVERIFSEVFGYGTVLNPTVHQGPAVEKLNQNGTHSGRVITCPIATPCEQCIYQRIIDNQVSADMVEDLRVVVIGPLIPLVYRKQRPLDNRFGNTNTVAHLLEPDAVFSAQERERILLFARRMGLDYGEIDALRDRGDGRLYLIDVNNTPFGPPNHIVPRDRRIALHRMVKAFKAAFLASTAGRL